MPTPTKPNPVLATRRNILRAMGTAFAVAPVAKLLGCGPMMMTGDDAGAEAGADAGVEAGVDAGADAMLADATAAEAATDAVVASEAGAMWATGGTAAMTMASSYPDPFAAGPGSTCTLLCAATLGPCYAMTLTRKDISEGELGLPVRMSFLVVDETCRPIANATVDVWHAAPNGLYSGSDASDMCTLGDATARAKRYFRGVQTTDANGRVDFDTCFPGWYSSRTIHVHFTVRVGGTEYVTSQLVFDDALCDDIIATQPIYSARGRRDTTNATDNVVNATTAPTYTFTTQRMPDGVMLASKTLIVRSSTGASLCTIGNMGGGMGGPGDGGMPPRGDGGMPPRPDGG